MGNLRTWPRYRGVCRGDGIRGSWLVICAGLLLQACSPAAPPSATGGAASLPFTLDPNPSRYQPLPRNDVLLTNATVLDGAGALLNGADVLVSDGKIAAIGPGLSAPDGAEVIDAENRWITPGIIDVHSHDGTYTLPLTSMSFDISDLSEISDPNSSEIWIEHAINVQDMAFARALSHGVTTIQVLPGSIPVFGGRGVVLKNVPATTVYSMKFPDAPQGVKMACGENPKSHFGESGATPTSRMGEVVLMRRAFRDASQYLDEWQAYVANPASNQPPERDYELDTLAGIMNGDMRVHAHCYRADDIAVLLGVAREFDFPIAAIHHAAEAYKIPEWFIENDVCAVVWSDWWGYKTEALDAIRENAAILDASGVCTMMHSDSPVVGQRLNLEAAKAAGAGRRAGIDIPPERAIRWITSGPARALGLDDRIGQISEGYNADLVVWSGDPFSVYNRAELVFIDGALVYDRSDPERQPRSDIELRFPGGEGAP
jgi:imidazolonepropionase-like amidohydrolase